MKKTTECGRSMIEMLGVLAIIGILSVGGFGLVTKMQDSHEKNQVIDQVGGLATRIRVLMRDCVPVENDKPTTGTCSLGDKVNDYVRYTKAYPDAFLSNEESENPGNNAFNGSADVKINVYYLGTSAALYAVNISDLTEEICTEIATTNWGNSATSGFVGLYFGGFNKDESSYADYPMSVAEAVSNCSEKTVTLVYR